LIASLVSAAVWGQTPQGNGPNTTPGGTVVAQAQPGAAQPGGGQPGGAQPQPGPAQPPAPQPNGGQPGQARAFPKGSVSDLLGTYHPRLEGLPAGVRPPLGTTPIPSRETLKKYVDQGPGINFVDPEFTIDLIVGIPRIWTMRVVPFRTQVADPRILDLSQPFGPIPNQYSLLGQAVGSTVLNVWVGDPNDVTKQTVYSYKVNVLPDPEAKERLERVYKALEDEINKAFPDAYVCLFLVGDKLVVTGQVKDAVEATQILQILRANAPATGPSGVATIPAQAAQRTAAGLNPLNLAATGGIAPNTINDYIIQGEQNLVNLLRIAGEQQVMLKVTVAEVSRAAARAIGLNETFRNKAGIQYFANTTGQISPNLPTVIDQGRINLAIEALRTVNLAKSLAEPNLVTMNGRPAVFFAGGEFPVPVVTGATLTGLQGVSFVPFGVFLQFVPYISCKDKIQLELSAFVSVRDVSTGTNFGTGATGNNTFVPGLNTRNIQTTVVMREGETLAIAGLIQNNLGADTNRVPLFGDIPFPGQLFRSDRTQASESELVLLVTPELVHPMEPKEIPPLPGSDYFEPGDLEFYLHGRLESWRPYSYRSPVMDDIHRMCAYRRCELLYFVGPHGHGGEDK
jgi:pilus assembly protein CpaC